MTVLMSSGKRRCDATCYDAKHDDCDCICGGANHRKGSAAPLRDHELLLVLYATSKVPERSYGLCEPEDFSSIKATLLAWGAKAVWSEPVAPTGDWVEDEEDAAE